MWTCVCWHTCTTSSGHLSSQLCIWPSLGNAFEALQKKLLCGLRPDASALLFTTALLSFSRCWPPACAVQRFVSLWCRAWACWVQPASKPLNYPSKEGGTYRNEKSQLKTLGVYRREGAKLQKQKRKIKHFQQHPCSSKSRPPMLTSQCQHASV